MNTDHWLPSKHGEEDDDAAFEAEMLSAIHIDVIKSPGLLKHEAQEAYVADRKAEGEKAFEEIAKAYDQAAARSRLNWLNEQRERLKQCLYDTDFQHVAEQIKSEARSLHMVPFNQI